MTEHTASAQPASTTALVIEDDDDIRRLLEISLSQVGFTVESVPEGESGLQRCAAGTFDLVTVDLGLPDVDGATVVRRLRNATPPFTGRIAVISARSTDSDRNASIEAGADLFLTKPFRPRELKEQFRALLG